MKDYGECRPKFISRKPTSLDTAHLADSNGILLYFLFHLCGSNPTKSLSAENWCDVSTSQAHSIWFSTGWYWGPKGVQRCNSVTVLFTVKDYIPVAYGATTSIILPILRIIWPYLKSRYTCQALRQWERHCKKTERERRGSQGAGSAQRRKPRSSRSPFCRECTFRRTWRTTQLHQLHKRILHGSYAGRFVTPLSRQHTASGGHCFDVPLWILHCFAVVSA